MCVSCATSSVYSTANRKVLPECNYTKEQVEAWKIIIQCGYENKLLADFEYHSSLGIIISATRRENVCYFQKYLITVELTINRLIAEGTCQ